jgi:hypothetical protein
VNQDQTIAASEIHVERVGICLDSGISEADAERQGRKEFAAYMLKQDVKHALDLPLNERKGFLDRLIDLRGSAHAAAAKEAVTAEWLRRKVARV